MMKSIQYTTSELDDFEVIGPLRIQDEQSVTESFKIFTKIWEELPKNKLIKSNWIKNKVDRNSLKWLFREILSGGQKHLSRKCLSNENNVLQHIWQAKISSLAKDKFDCGDIGIYQKLLPDDLRSIARLSISVDSIKKLPSILAKRGIILIYEKSLPGLKLDGTTFVIESGNPVIGLSLRFPRIDYFWFTLMHELAHVYAHYSLLENPILDSFYEAKDSSEEQPIENEANRIASNSLVARHLLRNISKHDKIDRRLAQEIADKACVHPAIVAGMIQKKTNNFAILREMVDEVDLRELIDD